MSEISPIHPAAERPTAAEVSGWLLEGRWFTIDLEGRVTAWSPAAEQRFGWERSEIAGASFVDKLLAPSARGAGAAAIQAALSSGPAGHAGFTGEVDALDAAGVPLRAAFALVPIQLSVGYEFNGLLQDISAAAGSKAAVAQLATRHESVLNLIESALTGRAAQAAKTDQGGRLAGAVVVYRAPEPDAAAPPPDNVVPIADAGGLEDARRELEDAEADLQRARNEVDVARQEAADAQAALGLAQRQAEVQQRQVDEARRAADDARGAAEASRIRTEEARREADGLRAELRDARDAVRGAMGQADDEIARLRGDVARHAAEATSLRERLQATQRDLGALRAELEAAHAEHQQAAVLSERRGGEIERLRGQLEERTRELSAARAEADELRIALEASEQAAGAELVHAEIGDDAAGAIVPLGHAAPSAEEIRRALEEDRFVLHGQPVMDLATDEVSQYELLIRMVAADGRLILPQAFLGPARRAGLAQAVDRWVVRRAIALLAAVPEHVCLEVNLSPEAVHDATLPVLIDEELAATPVDPARLVLEVTGATATADLDATRALAGRVRALGCRFALDDFRSTFGSFRLLKDLPLDYLKLDGELVGSLSESRTSQLIVKALVDVAAATATKTVAVFVSDDATLDMLRRQGVDYAQGYKVGRPRPLGD